MGNWSVSKMFRLRSFSSNYRWQFFFFQLLVFTLLVFTTLPRFSEPSALVDSRRSLLTETTATYTRDRMSFHRAADGLVNGWVPDLTKTKQHQTRQEFGTPDIHLCLTDPEGHKRRIISRSKPSHTAQLTRLIDAG